MNKDDQSIKFPVLIYDNLCTSCTTYAKYVNRIYGGRITMIGHYTQQGKSFKKSIFQNNYEGLEMSWFVTKTRAFGGREGLKQLIKYFFVRKNNEYNKNTFDLNECTTDCKTVKGVMIRSCSILTSGVVIDI
ncbi:MAG TPA: hypothetical protein HA319_04110 [Nitrosopumilaceae archaeon]|nr:hypothetical protein [Nitrosopumilaceae archaeon]